MNYAFHYELLMARARARTLEGYRERHHVHPRCMGGGDDPENIVELTPEEHYVAHQLLVKMHPANRGLVHAAFYMAKQCSGNKAFGWLRRRKAEAMLGNKISVGRKRTPEERAKQSASSKGRKRAPFSQEWRAKLSAARKGKPTTTGYKFSEESKAKMSAAKVGRPASPAALAAASAANKRRWQRYREEKAAR